jgi:hypothetical protein
VSKSLCELLCNYENNACVTLTNPGAIPESVNRMTLSWPMMLMHMNDLT